MIAGAARAFGYGSRYFGGCASAAGPCCSQAGTGPTRAARERGYYQHRDLHDHQRGARYVARIEQHSNPGYKAARCYWGCRLALTLDRDKLSELRGVLTPAAAMSDVLLTRLPAAGATLWTERLD